MADKAQSAIVSVGKDGEGSYSKVLNRSLRVFFKDALLVSLIHPSQAYFFFRTIRWQKRAARMRAGWEKQGIHVPPIMIFSITNRCNLHCQGCYHQALRQSPQAELSEDRLRGVIAEARELGISFVVLGGGEPLVRREMLDITRNYPDILFLVFTNGLLIDGEVIKKLKGQKNVVPVISLEGYEEDTDGRRGKGVYGHLREVIEKLKSHGIFWSVSLTVTRSNFPVITGEQFVKDLVGLGCKLFFLVEYTPIKEGTEGWLLTEEQRSKLLSIRDSFRSRFPALFIAVPGDEEEIGGCLSAGRGFVHISAGGDVEPCPFAPYSDTNVRETSLREALQSEFLKAIRQNRGQLRETGGGCILWVRQEWVRSLLHNKR